MQTEEHYHQSRVLIFPRAGADTFGAAPVSNTRNDRPDQVQLLSQSSSRAPVNKCDPFGSSVLIARVPPQEQKNTSTVNAGLSVDSKSDEEDSQTVS